MSPQLGVPLLKLQLRVRAQLHFKCIPMCISVYRHSSSSIPPSLTPPARDPLSVLALGPVGPGARKDTFRHGLVAGAEGISLYQSFRGGAAVGRGRWPARLRLA